MDIKPCSPQERLLGGVQEPPRAPQKAKKINQITNKHRSFLDSPNQRSFAITVHYRSEVHPEIIKSFSLPRSADYRCNTGVFKTSMSPKYFRFPYHLQDSPKKTL